MQCLKLALALTALALAAPADLAADGRQAALGGATQEEVRASVDSVRAAPVASFEAHHVQSPSTTTLVVTGVVAAAVSAFLLLGFGACAGLALYFVSQNGGGGGGPPGPPPAPGPAPPNLANLGPQVANMAAAYQNAANDVHMANAMGGLAVQAVAPQHNGHNHGPAPVPVPPPAPVPAPVHVHAQHASRGGVNL